MYTIKAKPISKDFWILRQDDKKVGQVFHNQRGYTVKVNGQDAGVYSSRELVEAKTNIKFLELPKPDAIRTNDAHGYPTDGPAFNAVWNIKYNLPLFTFTADSKSWYCAGYYKVYINKRESIEFCPKLITLQRNKYDGPHVTKPLSMFDTLMETEK